MATSSKRAYAVPRSAAPRAPALAAGHCWPLPPQETLKQFWLSLCGISGGLFEPSKCFWWGWGLILNVILPLIPSFWVFSFALGCGVYFGGIQHSPVYGCSALSYNFGALTGEDEHVSFYSAISKGDSFSRGWWVFKLGLEGDRQSVKFCFIPSSFHHSEETNLKTHPEEIYIRLIFFDQSVFPRGIVKS